MQPRVGFSLNFASLFSAMRDNSSVKIIEELCLMTMKNLKRNWLVVSNMTWEIWKILTTALKSLKNVHFNRLFLNKVYNVWDKKVQRSYVSRQWWVMQNLKENWLVFWKMTWRIWQIFTRALKSLNIAISMGSFYQK